MYPLSIVEDSADYLVVYKPRGIHSAPLSKSDGDSALSRIVTSYPEVGNVQGKNPVEGGLIHRIDKETEGLLLCAKNQDFYDYMDACQKKSVFFKEYIAVCDYIPRYSELMVGFPPCSEGALFEREENGFLNIPVSKPMVSVSAYEWEIMLPPVRGHGRMSILHGDDAQDPLSHLHPHHQTRRSPHV